MPGGRSRHPHSSVHWFRVGRFDGIAHYINRTTPANGMKFILEFLKKALALQKAAKQTSSIRYSYLLHELDHASARLPELEERHKRADHADVYCPHTTDYAFLCEKYASVSPKCVLINVR